VTINADAIRTKLPELASHFRGPELESLADALTLHEVPAGEVLVRDGADTESFYLVWEGRLVAYLESPDAAVELGHIGPGEWVGEVAMLDEGSATATVQAETDSKVLGMTRSEFAAFNQNHADVAGVVLKLLSHLMIARLRSADDLLLRRTDQSAGSKVSKHSAHQWSVNAYRKLIGATEQSA
jgi:CRP-like cAMP-binding protein